MGGGGCGYTLRFGGPGGYWPHDYTSGPLDLECCKKNKRKINVAMTVCMAQMNLVLEGKKVLDVLL